MNDYHNIIINNIERSDHTLLMISVYSDCEQCKSDNLVESLTRMPYSKEFLEYCTLGIGNRFAS